MRQPLVAGNWKLNGSRASAVELAEGVARTCASLPIETLVCPSFIHLPDVCQAIASLSGEASLSGATDSTAAGVVPTESLPGQSLQYGGLRLGAQDCSDQDSGAYTGEVSASQLAEYGVESVIVGHSERRALYGDSNQRVAEKFALVRDSGLRPIFCVGETAQQREAGTTRSVISEQLSAVMSLSGVEAFTNAVVAYEPVWAIGTGLTASPEQAQEVHAFLRAEVAQQNADIAKDLLILYGGSVKPANAAELFGQADIDGGLIGGAALAVEDFSAICSAAAAIAQGA